MSFWHPATRRGKTVRASILVPGRIFNNTQLTDSQSQRWTNPKTVPFIRAKSGGGNCSLSLRLCYVAENGVGMWIVQGRDCTKLRLIGHKPSYLNKYHRADSNALVINHLNGPTDTQTWRSHTQMQIPMLN